MDNEVKEQSLISQEQEEEIFEKQKKVYRKPKKYLTVTGGMLFFCASVIVIVTVFVTFFFADKLYYGGYFFKGSNKVSFDDSADEYKIAKLQTILQRIEEDFCFEYDVDDLIEGAIEGIVNALEDEYTVYFKPGDMDDFVDYVTGNFESAGFSYMLDQGVMTVTSVYPDMAADKNGIIPGDIIVSINNKEVSSMTESEINSVLGAEGTEVDVVVRSVSGTERKVTLKIEVINRSSVKLFELEDGIWRVVITQFDSDTGEEFLEAVNQLQLNGCTGIILDLRNNPGGFEKSAAKVADILLPEGIISYSKDKNGKITSEIESDSSWVDLPLTILVNGNSASAAEIVVGALRDHNRGTIVGTKTFGKGIGQIYYTFDKDGSGFKVTKYQTFTPSGECIHGVGITPDVIVEQAPEFVHADILTLEFENDLQLQKALSLMVK